MSTSLFREEGEAIPSRVEFSQSAEPLFYLSSLMARRQKYNSRYHPVTIFKQRSFRWRFGADSIKLFLPFTVATSSLLSSPKEGRYSSDSVGRFNTIEVSYSLLHVKREFVECALMAEIVKVFSFFFLTNHERNIEKVSERKFTTKNRDKGYKIFFVRNLRSFIIS